MISKLISALHEIHFEPTAEDIADILWLTLQMKSHSSEQAVNEEDVKQESVPDEQVQPLDEIDSTPKREISSTDKSEATEHPANGNLFLDTEQDSDDQIAYSSSVPFKSPAAPALPYALDLSRALRPLMRRIPSRTHFVFDEKATAYSIAEQCLAQQDTWIPIQHPALERWLEVALVVDESRSMAIWYQTIVELQLLLERLGAFRDVRIWGLVKDSNEQGIHLRAGMGLTTTTRQLHKTGELLDPTGRRLILIVSDCVSSIWRNGIMTQVLEQWGGKGPVAIIQVLAQKRWARSGLDTAVEARMHAPSAGLPNTHLNYEPTNPWIEKDALQNRLPVPVVSLKPIAIRQWAKAITGTEITWIPGYVFDTCKDKQKTSEGEIKQEQVVAVPLTADESLKRFRATASPTACDLAGLLAAAPISLPVVRVIQKTMLPDSEQSHVAEVFLSGLLEQLPTKSEVVHPDYVQYDFVQGVRELLLNSMPISESIQVLKEVSDFVASQYGQALDFRALLADPTSLEGKPINEVSRPFAIVASQVLRRIGGDYATLAQHLEEAGAPQKQLSKSNGTGVLQSRSGTEPVSVTVNTPEEGADGQQYQSSIQTDSEIADEEVHSHREDDLFKTESTVLSPAAVRTQDFYISYTAADREWAEWIAWTLEREGYTTVLRSRDFQPGDNFILEMSRGLTESKRIIAVLSPDYMYSTYGIQELQTALAQGPRGERSRVVPVRVREFDYEQLRALSPIIYIDLVGLDEMVAREVLLDGIRPSHVKSMAPPAYPGRISRVEIATSLPPAFPSTLSPTQQPLRLFYSYAHTDEKLRIKFNEHLATLQHQGYIAPWHDRNIAAGTPWTQQISSHLEEAHIILLLISADFIASDYCYSIEMTRAMERHKAGEARVIPIILRPVSWQNTPFGTLQALPKDGKPVTTWTNQDTAWQDIAESISAVVQELQATPPVRPVSLWNIPYRRNLFFTGREEVLQRLHNNLTTTGTAALTQAQAISGLGGIGKTQIALEYAYRYRDAYRYALWVRAATRETLIGDFVALAGLLHLPERDEQDQTIAVAAVTHWLASHDSWLLILDNADDLAMVSDFLPPTSTGHLLLTTRAQAIGQLAQRIEIEKMQSEEGVLFLLRRANIGEPSASDRAKATEIVQVMDGLPLALDQAGAYIEETSCGLADYLTLYQTQPQKLLGRRGSLKLDYPDSVAKTWSLSFEQVQQTNPAAADLLRLCAFLATDAIPEALITDGASQLGKVLSPIAADPFRFNEALEVLGRYSLLRRNPAMHTLSMHRLVQTVLKDSMNAKTQRQWASRTVKAVDEAFPDVTDVRAWPHCDRALPHALACAELIAYYDLAEPQAASLLNRTAYYLHEHARYAEAEPLYQRALAICEQVLGAQHPDTALSLNNLALLYHAQGKYERAKPLYQRALRIYEQVLGAQHPDTASSLNNLALLYYAQGKYEQAEPLYQRALRIYEQVLGPEHPYTATTLHRLASLYQDQGKYEQAEPLYQRALAIKEQVLGPEHPEIASTLHELARLYQSQGKYEQAEPLYQRALAIKEQVLGPEHPETASTLSTLGGLYRRKGEYEKALEFYEGAYHADPTSSYALGNVATLTWYLGNLDKARRYYILTEAASTERTMSAHTEVYWDYYDLALAQLVLGKTEEAKKNCQKAITNTPGGVQFDSVLNVLYFLQKAKDPIAGLNEIIHMIEKEKSTRISLG